MKYLIGNQCINADHIARVEFDPARDESQSDRCVITTNANDCSGEGLFQILLLGTDALLFWQAYSGDAFTVVSP